MTRAKWLTAIAVASIVTSCQLPVVDIECTLSAQTNDSQAQIADKQSDTINIEIQVDATPSMKGFVDNPRPSRYEQTLDLLDLIATASWSEDKSSIKYYRFGTYKKEISKQTYINAKTPGFYAGGGIFNDSQILATISTPSPNKLSIIVTDLYQTDNDISSVIGELKTKYLQKDYAVGILGIRSEFMGKVYDIGVRNITRDYRTDDKKPDTFRPFYVIILGTPQNVSYYFEELQQKNGTLIDSKHFIIFHPQVIQKASSFNFDIYSSELRKRQKDFVKVRALNDGKIRGKIINNSSIEALRIKGKLDDNYDIGYTVAYYPLLYTLQVDTSQYNAFVLKKEVKVLDRKEQAFKPSNGKGFQFNNWKINEAQSRKELSFTTQVIPSSIKPGIYTLTVELIPNKFIIPEWWKTWNFEESTFDRNNADKFDGSSTLNLQNFLEGLKVTTTNLIKANSPVASRLCFAIQRD